MLNRRALFASLLAGLAASAPALAEPRSRTRNASVAGPHGAATGTSTRSWDRAAGTTSRNATQTGPGGRTRAVAGQGSVQNGSYTGTRTVTAPGGQTRTQDVTVSRQ